MKVYTNTVDTIVAKDKEDLHKFYTEYYDGDEEFEGDGYYEWVEVDQEEMLLIFYWADDWKYVDKSEIPPEAKIEQMDDSSQVHVEALVKEWAKYNGRGFLCSTEY